jgi:hypothetical protein
MNYKRALQGVASCEPVLNRESGSINFLAQRQELAWSIYLNADGTLFQIDAHDLRLIRENNEDDSEDFVLSHDILRAKLAIAAQI